ncbi:proline dehydrogenase family protein [Thermomicrobium sp. 4228-Ro]|uniref:proline dehydrogenase family protein n=1 Tax=Thermomicrobium sp. 4228-Ro TaxID=2993937 RepID=UPI00224958F3|nr:proline dehydrogenase family protein [Thermomicrobium sp. 4228-Ro]MCX2727762.1 proline dehydrogenase family protein [Thermomicrobium sp. 4228-Ro]
MPLFRSLVLAIARHPTVERLARETPFLVPLVTRFVAGETMQEALAVARALADRGFTTTLDLLGEDVRTPTEAAAATEAYAELLQAIARCGIDATISVKPTHLGLRLDPELARLNLERLARLAQRLGGRVEVDMEDSSTTRKTIELFDRLHCTYGDHLQLALQSYLYRTEQDIERAVERGWRIRLVKGAYAEPPTVAYPSKAAVDAAYRRHMEALLEYGRFVAIATHDDAIIRVARGFARRIGVGPEKYEFQMLYGVRRDLQDALRRAGEPVRIYVPFGRHWYPYFTRRLAERPANLLFLLRQLLPRG